MVQVHRMCHLTTFLVICTAAVLDKTKYDLVDGGCKKMCLSKRSSSRASCYNTPSKFNDNDGPRLRFLIFLVFVGQFH